MDEYRWFETLARDFQYVPRPSIKGEIQVTLEANGPLPGRAFTAFGAFFQKVEPIDRSPGSLRAVTKQTFFLLGLHLALGSTLSESS